MKKTIFLPACFALALLGACNNENKSETTTATEQVSADTAKPAAVMPVDPGVQKFVDDAAIAGMMEIELGNIAKSKTANQKVKDFADMMVTDHTAAANDLKSVASANGIMVPAALPSDKKEHIDMMKNMKGKDFDKHYIEMMAEGHTKVVDEFKSASKDLKNDPIKDFATRTLPTLEKHLASAKAINKTM